MPESARPVDFVEFASLRASALFRSAYLLTGDFHLAEDLAQITLGKLYSSWDRVARADNPVAYAHTVLVRTFLSHRRLRRCSEVPTSNLPDRGATESEDDPALRVAVLSALRQLSPKDRAVVVLRYWEDRSVEETARRLGIRDAAVRTRSRRALARLRDHLGHDFHEFTCPERHAR
jgi:RNA polymerase sigma-70 factor (sigma-E family)